MKIIQIDTEFDSLQNGTHIDRFLNRELNINDKQNVHIVLLYKKKENMNLF